MSARASPALRARLGRFSPPGPGGRFGFFSAVSSRDPLTLRTHSDHWIELAMMANEPHSSPIRRVPSLYNIFDGRSKGMATGVEEWLMHAGLFDASPRSRELIYVLRAQRAARALGGLKMRANQATIDQAVQFASENTPRGWLPPDGDTVWGEQHRYLQQPGYETSYLGGKMEIEWMRPFVQKAAGRKAADVQPVVVDLGQRVGVLRPIGTAGTCRTCHGAKESQPEALQRALAGLYPRDKAVGFAEGDVRGFFWAAVNR